MKKEELYEKIKRLPSVLGWQEHGAKVMIAKDSVLKLVRQVEQPQKVVIPKFVAEWIERCRANEFNLQHAMDSDHAPSAAFAFILNEPERFARAWLDGYVVERM